MNPLHYLLAFTICMMSNCTNDCVQRYYNGTYKGIVTSKYLSSYKNTPTIEIMENHNKQIIQLIGERDTVLNPFWFNMQIGDSISKKEGLDYLIIKSDTTITVTLECSAY